MPRFSVSLSTTHPGVASEWHPERNGALTPRDVTYGSAKHVWWRCAAKGHEWQAMVFTRSKGSGCPYCSGRYPSEENNLQALHPELAREWNQERNGDLTPRDVTPGSHKVAFWVCPKGHVWEAQVRSRVAGQGCPYCSGRRVCEDNCLETLNPELAKQWHPARNGQLTPRDVTRWSNRKVYWVCEKGHEWQARVFDRSRGKGCGKCRWGKKDTAEVRKQDHNIGRPDRSLGT